MEEKNDQEIERSDKIERRDYREDVISLVREGLSQEELSELLGGFMGGGDDFEDDEFMDEEF